MGVNLHFSFPGGASLGNAAAVALARMESIAHESDNSETEEDEFYDAKGLSLSCQFLQSCIEISDSNVYISEAMSDTASLQRWSSMELIPEVEEESQQRSSRAVNETIPPPNSGLRIQLGCDSSDTDSLFHPNQPVTFPPTMKSPVRNSSCPTTILLLVFHGGNVLDNSGDIDSKNADLETFKGVLDSVVRQHYASMASRIALRLVPCPPISQDALHVFSKLCPYSFDVSPCTVDGTPPVTHDAVPLGALPLFAASYPDYWEQARTVIHSANCVYREFLASDEGKDFTGQVTGVADPLGSMLLLDALSSPLYQAMEINSEPPGHVSPAKLHSRTPPSTAPASTGKRTMDDSKSSVMAPADTLLPLFDFDLADVFLLGSPVPLVIAFRKIAQVSVSARELPPERPYCHQVYNLFYPIDPLAVRLEPLISARFASLPPLAVPRYSKYPLGDGAPTHYVEYVQSHPIIFANSSSPHMSERSRKTSDSTFFGNRNISLTSLAQLASKWWGHKRLDYALYCPEGLTSFPTSALPHILHASLWESQDVVAFILRQIVIVDPSMTSEEGKGATLNVALPNWPAVKTREKWLKKRTSVKLRNVSANHRANDVIVGDKQKQVLTARFMYGPLDMVALSGERVDVYVIKDQRGQANSLPAGAREWTCLGTGLTDKHGRLLFALRKEQELDLGVYPVKMVVRGDLTAVDFHLAVVPTKTECVVFSIDGSFTASVSVTGKDPKVRPGAVDVVRHWQELGYLIIYITGRPDMQQRRVVSWLAQHNFPHGLVSFADGLSPDFLSHKAGYMASLVQVKIFSCTPINF